MNIEKLISELLNINKSTKDNAIETFKNDSPEMRSAICSEMVKKLSDKARRMGYELLKYCDLQSDFRLLIDKWTEESRDNQAFILLTINHLLKKTKQIEIEHKEKLLQLLEEGLNSTDPFIAGYSAEALAEITGIIPLEIAESLFLRGEFWLSEKIIEILKNKNILYQKDNEKIIKTVLSAFTLNELNGRFLLKAAGYLLSLDDITLNQTEFNLLLSAFKQLDELLLDEFQLKNVLLFLSRLKTPNNEELKRRIYFINSLTKNHNIKVICSAVLEKIGYPAQNF